MKKIFAFLLVLAVFAACAPKNEEVKQERIVLAYVFGDRIMPDPAIVTHINYAFGHVTDTYDGVRINNEDQLRAIVALKEQKPSLKILLSIGGWGSGRFNEMSDNHVWRESFARDCKRVVDEFGLDGIDLDWEYPVQGGLNQNPSPKDYDNYTLLSMDIRKEIGPDKLLTMATLADATPICNWAAIEPYYSFFNIMTYDLAFLSARDPYHQGALYRSDKVRRISCEEAVDNHIKAGIPPEKLNLGILFGGRGNRIVIEGDTTRYGASNLPEGYTRQWDDVAKAAYITNPEGEFWYSFEEARAIEHKMDFIKERGLLGTMYWSYNDQAPVFSKIMYDRLVNNIASTEPY